MEWWNEFRKALTVRIAEGKAENALNVTPNDSTDLASTSVGIYVGVSGDLKVTLKGGAVITFIGLSSGVIHPIAATRIWATGTTATNIVAVI